MEWFQGDEHWEHLDMFWQRLIFCLAAAETGQVTMLEARNLLSARKSFPRDHL